MFSYCKLPSKQSERYYKDGKYILTSHYCENLILELEVMVITNPGDFRGCLREKVAGGLLPVGGGSCCICCHAPATPTTAAPTAGHSTTTTLRITNIFLSKILHFLLSEFWKFSCLLLDFVNMYELCPAVSVKFWIYLQTLLSVNFGQRWNCYCQGWGWRCCEKDNSKW